jgi:hypothetical protein
VSQQLLEHILDKYGFPVAVVLWMFWRDWYFLRTVAVDIKVALSLLEKIATDKKPREQQ